MRCITSGFSGAALALGLAVPGTAFAQEQPSLFDGMRFTATLATDYSNGNYDTNRNTNVEIGLTTLSLATDSFKFSASMPYMRISGRGLVVFDAAGNPVVINRRTTLPPDVREGFGDLNLSATYTLPPAILDDFQLKLTGSAKLPTASERRRLSTGTADFGLSLDVSRQFGDWGPFVTMGYLFAGQPVARTYTLYNTVSVSVGTSYVISDDLVAVASYDYDSASTPLVTASHEFFGSLSWFRSDSITLTGYGTYGLSDGSPDIGLGMLVSYGLN